MAVSEGAAFGSMQMMDSTQTLADVNVSTHDHRAH